jgi:hypothetical protein
MQKNAIRAQVHKYTSTLCTCSLMMCVLVLFGCAGQQQYAAAEPVCVENVDNSTVIEMVEDVLAGMHFTIDKADAEMGLIRTKPLTGAQFFEFWRSDNLGSDNWLRANLHSIRRIVELNINEQDEGLCVSCSVQVQRLSLPERDVGGEAHAYEMFSISGPALQKLQLDSEQKAAMVWIDLGQDSQLAAEILNRIEQRIGSRLAVDDEI